MEDGAGAKPGYSLRTLCRALVYARAALPVYGLERALWDGAAMAFLTQLAPSSAPALERLLRTQLLPGLKSLKARSRRSRPTPTLFSVRSLCALAQQCRGEPSRG